MLLILMLAACGGDRATEETKCEGKPWGPDIKRCERGCAMGPSGGVNSGGTGKDMTCFVDFPGTLDPATNKPIHGACNTEYVATFEGERGCCAVPRQPIAFVACEAQ